MSDTISSWIWEDASSPSFGNDTIAPAFSSFNQAIFFLSIVIFALSLPILVDITGLIGREQSYEIMPERHGGFSFARKEIFESKKEIDLVFVGSSVLFSGIDTPQVRQRLSAELGREAHVVTFGHYFNSMDITYMQVKDLLEHKRPRMVALSIPRISYTDGPSALAYKFIRYSESRSVLSELPYRYRASLYACSVLRSPHDLLSMIRRNRHRSSEWDENLGADKFQAAMGRDIGKFVQFHPKTPEISEYDLVYSSSTADRFEFLNDPIGDYQEHYFEKIIELLRAENVPIMIINIPQYTERHSSRIFERENWNTKFQTPIPLVGIQPSVLFSGLSDEEIELLYFDDSHFNVNGNEYFTAAILPGILKAYKENAN